ncbi:hypothetical protein OCL06_10870 [Alteromonas sp. ASW11-19]|uniref:Uncharacterized protein n=1 Tax=Alteromonas salexigens TaxID=2982530 RepID=A0ABT2VPU9_9ALTE|nr:hypothetical protein [Alteromonas salexigens]MCU7555099.1 hypothetical protein [Alteromonas salexigens]
MLSDYQRAVLQVMGIPVWEAQVLPQEKTSGDSTGQPETAQTRPAGSGRPVADGAARLAALRAQVTTSDDKVAKPAASPKSDTRTTRSLTAEESQHAAALLKDIQLAAESINSEHTPLEFEIGDAMAKSAGRITFPQSPVTLSAAQKRQLWQLLWQPG